MRIRDLTCFEHFYSYWDTTFFKTSISNRRPYLLSLENIRLRYAKVAMHTCVQERDRLSNLQPSLCTVISECEPRISRGKGSSCLCPHKRPASDASSVLLTRHSTVNMWKSLVIFGFLLVACSAITFLPGGFQTVDVDDEGVVTAANEATRQLSKNFANKYHHRLTKVLKAKQQVVSGMNYQMDIIVGMTTCRKDEFEFDEAQECDFQDSVSTYKKCTIRVYRDLKDNHKLITFGCILASKNDL